MRPIITAAFVSLDGVMQAPGGPDEDRSGGFELGGWLAPFMDDVLGAEISELLITNTYDLLLGRKTYDIFASYWPSAGENPDEGNRQISKKFDAVTKYVATHDPSTLTWQRSRDLGNDVVASLRSIKQEEGPPLVTQGSSALLHTLFAHDLVDEIRLFVFPVTLGRGKRFFGAATPPRTFEVTRSTPTTRGAQLLRMRRVGEVVTGSLAT